MKLFTCEYKGYTLYYIETEDGLKDSNCFGYIGDDLNLPASAKLQEVQEDLQLKGMITITCQQRPNNAWIFES